MRQDACACRIAILCRSGFGVGAGEDGEGRGSGGSGRETGGFENRFELAGADDGVDFRNVFAGFRRGSARRGSPRR